MSKKYIAIIIILNIVLNILVPVFAEEVEYTGIPDGSLDPNVEYQDAMPLIAFSDYYKLVRNSDGPNTYTVASYDTTIYTNTVVPEVEGKVITRIGTNAFKDKPQICGEIKIPASVLYIEDGAFENCQTISSIIFEGNTKTIGSRAFYNCGSLEKIRFSDKLENIGSYAFYKCAKLEGVDLEIPKSVNYIGNFAFFGTNLRKIIFTKLQAPTIEANTFVGTTGTEIRIPLTNATGYTVENHWPLDRIDTTLYGDVNNDGKINSTDAAVVLQLYTYSNWTANQLKMGDMDGNGKLNSSDAAAILELF